MQTQAKYSQLLARLREMESVLVAFSGGVDSTLVLKAAREALGEAAAGAIAVSPSLPAAELVEARTLAAQIAAPLVEIPTHEVEDPNYIANGPDRCYFCKQHVGRELLDYARQNGYRWVADGTNADDARDHRPGRQAARELGLSSPLLEAGLTKAEIRTLARQAGLPNWDKPAAACLSSRLPYGTPVQIPVLNQIEQAEAVLRALGFSQLRVRHHDQVARLEVEPGELEHALQEREAITAALKSLGYTYVTLDLEGFRSGNLNQALRKNGHRQTTPASD